MTSHADLWYLAERLRDALVRDPGIGEQDVHVEVSGSELRLSGTVTTETRHEAILAAVGRLVPGAPVRDEVRVVTMAPEPKVEPLQ